jgi:hypothetical protein
MTPEHAHNLSSYFSFSSHSPIVASLLLNSSSFSLPSQLLHWGFFWWVVCLCSFFLPSFHWLDHVAAVWFRFVTRMYEPGDCIRVSRVKYLCSTTTVFLGVVSTPNVQKKCPTADRNQSNYHTTDIRWSLILVHVWTVLCTKTVDNINTFSS